MTTSWEASVGLNQIVRELDKEKPFLIQVGDNSDAPPQAVREVEGALPGCGGAGDRTHWPGYPLRVPLHPFLPLLFPVVLFYGKTLTQGHS